MYCHNDNSNLSIKIPWDELRGKIWNLLTDWFWWGVAVCIYITNPSWMTNADYGKSSSLDINTVGIVYKNCKIWMKFVPVRKYAGETKKKSALYLWDDKLKSWFRGVFELDHSKSRFSKNSFAIKILIHRSTQKIKW